MKNAFYFILKGLFVLQIFKFLSWFFDHVGKIASFDECVLFQVMTRRHMFYSNSPLSRGFLQPSRCVALFEVSVFKVENIYSYFVSFIFTKELQYC